MPFLRFFILFIVVSVGLVADSYYQCYRYSKSDLGLNTPDSFGYIYLAMPSKPSYRDMGYLLFTDKSRSKIIFLQSIGCKLDKTKNLYSCSGECDSGRVVLDKNMNFTLGTKYPLVVQKETLESDIKWTEPPEAISIIQKAKPAQATKVLCPPAVTTLYHPKRDTDTQHAHYVCYKQKIYENKNGKKSPKYFGCTLSKQLCRYDGLHYFGHYPNDSATQEALVRCQNSTPNLK